MRRLTKLSLFRRNSLSSNNTEKMKEFTFFLSDLKTELAAARRDLKMELAAAQQELKTELATAQRDLKTELAAAQRDLKTELSLSRAQLEDRLSMRQTQLVERIIAADKEHQVAYEKIGSRILMSCLSNSVLLCLLS